MKQQKILVVDDEVDIRNAFQKALAKADYDVRLAESGEEALEILASEKIHVMFLDLNMSGMDGLELCKEIRKTAPMAVIHAVTGYSSLFELADAREAGFDDYHKKPMEITALLKAAMESFEKVGRWRED